MPDAVGYRSKIGVVIPSTNTVVESDFNAVHPPGVTFHTGRMYIAEPAMDSDEAFEHLMHQIRESLAVAIRDVLTCEPDYLIMAMSSETFWGGAEGSEQFTNRVKQMSGLGVSSGAVAAKAALEVFGAKKIAVLTPYQPIADRQVMRYFEDCGFKIVRLIGLRCSSATAIAQVREDELRRVLRQLDAPDADAIIQVGTNLSMVRLADEAERWLGKPIIAINAATLWHALRANGIDDRFRGFGSLLEDH